MLLKPKAESLDGLQKKGFRIEVEPDNLSFSAGDIRSNRLALHQFLIDALQLQKLPAAMVAEEYDKWAASSDASLRDGDGFCT